MNEFRHAKCLISYKIIYMGLWGESKIEKEAFEIIDRLLHNESTLLHIVERLLPKESPSPTSWYLKSIYNIVTPSGDITFVNNKNSNMPAQTITVLDGQNNVPGQLVPLAADGTTVEPISTINAGSEVYASSNTAVATVAPVSGGPEGSFLVTRVPGAIGSVTISYNATNTQGTAITGFDNFIFQGPLTGIAASLTATYGQPTV